MGLIHRDIKPANIFAAYRGGQYDVAKLLDFGLVKPTRDEASPASDARGHGHRLAALHGARAGHADAFSRTPRSDIYALGAVAYFLLTGRPPFVSDDAMEVMMAHARDPVVPPSRLRADVPDDLEEVVLRCLAKDPDDRYQDAAEPGDGAGRVRRRRRLVARAGRPLVAGSRAGDRSARRIGRALDSGTLRPTARSPRTSHRALEASEIETLRPRCGGARISPLDRRGSGPTGAAVIDAHRRRSTSSGTASTSRPPGPDVPSTGGQAADGRGPPGLRLRHRLRDRPGPGPPDAPGRARAAAAPASGRRSRSATAPRRSGSPLDAAGIRPAGRSSPAPAARGPS